MLFNFDWPVSRAALWSAAIENYISFWSFINQKGFNGDKKDGKLKFISPKDKNLYFYIPLGGKRLWSQKSNLSTEVVISDNLSSFFLIYLSDSLKIFLIWMTIEICKFEYLQNLLMLSGQPLSKSGFDPEIFRSEP